MSYNTILLNIDNQIAHLRMNNPSKANAMSKEFWEEMRIVMPALDENPEVRVVVISGEGKHFTAGIDLQMFAGMGQEFQNPEYPGRLREQFRRDVLKMQDSFTAIERCRKPVLAAIQGACVGAGIDMITACDMRYCTQDAYFSIKEIDIGMVADVGTLQRLPKIIAEGVARELAYTGRTFYGKEAKEIHLINQHFEHKDLMMEEVFKIAETIAAKSPLSIRGTKEIINYTRDHSVADSLNYIATWNAAMLYSKDIQEAMMANMMKKKPEFAD
ncbi:MAG: crotonase/enoyl-CoA hydratase family protein [Bacteroidota bacterium]